MTLEEATETIISSVRSALRTKPRTIPELFVALDRQLPPQEIGHAVRELVKRGEAIYEPLVSGAVQVPAFRKAVHTLHIELTMTLRSALQEHFGVWSVREKPPASVGTTIVFTYGDDVCDSGIIEAIDPPSGVKSHQDWTGVDRSEWWTIRYASERAVQA